MHAALIQLNASDDPEANLPITRGYVEAAADAGARLILTPEVTNCVSASRTRQAEVLKTEEDDVALATLREVAAAKGIWLLIGSLALKGEGARFVNRSFLIDPEGEIAARYDKIHMFDVEISETETYLESAGYAPGNHAVVADVEGVTLGLSICYDLRFPYLYRDLAQAGAEVIAVPSAFSPETGRAHWEPLLRARAIECGAYVLAPAQSGTHTASEGRMRQTYGHTLAIDPWGGILARSVSRPGVVFVEIDSARVADVRRRLPSLTHDRTYAGPT